MDGFAFGTLSLQSGIVIAALVAAVFLADRLGGDDGIARKGSQLALAFAITLTVFSGTAAFIRPPDPPESDESFFEGGSEQEEQLANFLKDSAERDSEAGSLHLGIGLALIVIGAALLRRLSVLPTGLMFGGILLLLLGAAPQSGTTGIDVTAAIYAPILSYSEDAGQARDIIRFVVLLAGTALILILAVARWELPPPGRRAFDEPPPPVSPAEPAQESTLNA